MKERRLFLHRIASLATLALALCTGGLHHAQAQTSASAKISVDLRAAAAAPSGSAVTVPWAKSLNGALHVQVLINSNSIDSSLVALRQDVLARGGSVYYNYLSVRALGAMVPAGALDALAQRTDVLGIAPNRATSRHASLLQSSSGASEVLPLGNGGTSATSLGLDGRLLAVEARVGPEAR